MWRAARLMLHERLSGAGIDWAANPSWRPGSYNRSGVLRAKKGFWVYLATTGDLLRPDVPIKLGDAGIAVIQLCHGTRGI